MNARKTFKIKIECKKQKVQSDGAGTYPLNGCLLSFPKQKP
jgi:hypothetical protein